MTHYEILQKLKGGIDRGLLVCHDAGLNINSHVPFLHVCQAHYYGVVSVGIHVADFSDMLMMFCFCNTYFLLMNICLIFVPYNLQKLQS
jgi:hypothetical protein